jgi:hypothetical protein
MPRNTHASFYKSLFYNGIATCDSAIPAPASRRPADVFTIAREKLRA